jgi:hypothetical protein
MQKFRLWQHKKSIIMNHFISLAAAKDMTERYRMHRESILKTEFQNQNLLPICESFDKSPFEALLSKSNCAGLRIYYGMDENLKIHAIIVAFDEQNEDILPSSLNETEDEDIIDNGNRCPELCPPSSELNS